METDFDHKFEWLRQQVVELQRRATQSQAQHQISQDAYEELLTALEELQVAEEQLLQQNDELVATRYAVEAERQRYQDLFEFAPDGYLVTDPEGTIHEANHAAASLLNIARELHDEVGQILTGLNLLLGMSPRAPADTIETRLEEGRDLVEELMEKVDELSLDLRPAMLDDLGLLPTLLWHFERYTARTAVRVHLEHSGMERRFAAELETAFYRVVQEALTNVARHAGVHRVAVRLWADQNILGVQIEDQGIGFDPQADLVAQDTVGLSGMYERAALLGGQLIVEAAPGIGTCLTAEWPLDGRDREEVL